MTSVATHITNASKRYADRVAFICGERRITFREFDTRVNRLANGLLRFGFSRGDRVGVLFLNSIEGVEAMWAGYKSGIVPVALNPRLPAEELLRQLRHSGSRGLILAPEFVSLAGLLRENLSLDLWSCPGGGEGIDALEALADGQPSSPPEIELGADDELHHGYGSGTTGTPKCIVEHHGRWLSLTGAVLREFDVDVRPDDVVLHIAPVTHASGAMVLPHYMRGAANCLLPVPDLETFFGTIQRERVTRTLLVPTLLTVILDHPGIDKYDLTSLRHVIYGSSPIAPDLLRRAMDRFGPIFEQYYGLGEYAPATVLRASDHVLDGPDRRTQRLASAGQVVLDTEIAVWNEDGKPLEAGETGEVVLRGPGAFSGYWHDPELTAETLSPAGWVRTGDVGYLDDDGYLFLVDRKKNMIITGGFNVYPAGVEKALMAHPAVLECAVIGVPDKKWGEAVTAVVVLKHDASAAGEDLIDFVRPSVAKYEVPKRVEFVDELPKNPSGKILHRELRERFWAGEDRRVR